MNVAKEIGIGTVGGIMGTAVMTVGMVVGQLVGAKKPPPPIEVERALAQRAGVAEQIPAPTEQMLAGALHLALGMAYGAGYGLLQVVLPLRPILAGSSYGLVIYALSLAGVGPALGLAAGPWRERAATVWRRVLLHVVYGVVTAYVTERLHRRLTR